MKRNKIKNKILYGLSIGIFVVLCSVFWIGANPVSAAGTLTLSASSRSPVAGERFTVRASSLEFDALRSNFSWYADDKLITSGVGRTEATFRAGPIGSALRIRVTATSNQGDAFEGSTIIRVNDIDFIVYPLTYTPPLYRGAPLAIPGSSVEIYAVPHLYISGGQADPKNVIYDWTVDDRKEPDPSAGG